MTLDQLASEMALEFGEAYSDLDVSMQFQAWTNEAINEVYSAARWFFKNQKVQIDPVMNQAEYTLPATVSQVRDVQVPATGLRIAFAPVERLIARGYNLALPGTPKAWYISGVGTGSALKISFWPVPDIDFINAIVANPKIDVHAIKRPSTLQQTDEIPLPEEYLRVVREGIRSRVKYNDNDFNGAEFSRKLFEAGLADLNRTFHGPEKGGSDLRVKMLHATRQQPSAPEGS